MTGPIPPAVAERAATKFTIDAAGCHISTYSVGSHGYAQVGWQVGDGKIEMTTAHRAAWVHFTGQQPVGQVDHECHVRTCVRREHLRDIDSIDNARRNSPNRPDWPLGQLCRQGHGPEHQIPLKRRNRKKEVRMSTTCGQCMKDSRERYKARKRGML